MATPPMNPAMFDASGELAVQQAQQQRQQQLAQALMAQSMQQPQGQMAGNVFVGPSWTQHLSNFLKGVQAQNIYRDSDEATRRTAAAMGAANMGMFTGNPPTDQSVSSPASPPSAASPPPASPSSAVLAGALTQPAPSQGGVYGSSLARLGMTPQQGMNLKLTNPELFNQLVLKANTEQSINNAYLGISPQEQAIATRAANTKAGIIERQPGVTTTNLATGEDSVAPDFKSGIQGGFDAQGRPIMGAIQGSEVIANQAGAAKRAEQENTIFTNLTVDGREGVPMFGGDIPRRGAAPTAPTAPPAPFSQTATSTRNIQLLTQELAKPNLNPRQRAALEGELANEQQLLSSSAAPKFGQAPATKTFETARATDAAAYAKELDTTIGTLNDEVQRVGEMKRSMAGFTPGAGQEGRLMAARYAKAAGWDSLATRIQGGDVGAVQEFQKLAAGQAMQDLKSMLANGRMTQAEFKVFQANNPNIELDPGAINKIFDFINQRRDYKMNEQTSFNDYLDKGGDPSRWQNVWNTKVNQEGLLKAEPSAPAPAQASSTTFKDMPDPKKFDGKRMSTPDGKIIKSVGGQWILER